MHDHQLSQLTYEDAISEFGAAITSFHVGQIVLLDEASATFLAKSDEPITPINSIVIAKITEVNSDGNMAKLIKLRRISPNGFNSPESGEDDFDIDYLTKSVEDRIKASDDYFRQK